MILTDFEHAVHVQEKKSLELSPDIFDEARALYRDIPEYRYDPIVVKHNGERVCLLRWKSNNITSSKRQNLYRIATCGEYWRYSTEDERMDLRLLQEADAFYFEDLDEYSTVIAKIIQKYYPEKNMYFREERAEAFFEQGFGAVFGIDPETAAGRQSGNNRMMKISAAGGVVITKEQMGNLEYSSLQVMHSIYWMSQEVHFGDKNPDRLIALIKSPLAFEGLAGTLRYVLNKAAAIEESGFGADMAVDLGILSDENQFFPGSGENVWEAYFEPLSEVSVTDAYESAHVVCSMEAMKTVNPWLWKQDASSDYEKLVSKYLRFNARTREYLEKQYRETIPAHAGKLLGVVGRGSDYNMTLPKGYKGELMRPLSPEEILKKTMDLVERDGYEYVFLATEDQVVFDLYMKSPVKDKVLYVPQERITYSEHDQTAYLADIYKEQEGRDGYSESLRYLGIINILSRCDALISTTMCGAAKIAWGLNQGRYTYIDVPGLNS